MKFTILASLAMAGAASAWTIPSDLADGIYHVPVDANFEATGAPKYVRSLGDNHRRATAITPIPDPEVACTGVALDSNRFPEAQAALYSYCGTGGPIPGKTVIAAVRGNTVAFVCNYGDSNSCSSDEYDVANGAWDDKCGQWQSGWFYISDWAKTYGRDVPGNSVCSNANLKYTEV